MDAETLNNPNAMIAQMVLALDSDMGRERAMEHVARLTGLSYSKVFRLFYRQSFDVWSRQKKKMTAAFKTFAASQARLYRARAATYDAVCQQIEQIERQNGFDFASVGGAAQLGGGNADGISPHGR